MNALIRTAAATVLLFSALAANAKPASTPTPQQRQAAQKLAGISVRILDLGQLFRYDGSADSWYKQFQANMTAEEFRCFTTKMGTSQGFRAYKMDEALHYVQHRSPQDLQRDFALLTPQTVQALSRLMSAWEDGIAHNNNDRYIQEMDRLQQNPRLFNAVSRFMESAQHHDLRQLLLSFAFDTAPEEDGARSIERYRLWSLRECHISAEELRAGVHGISGK
ncbi:hypothetical protein [Kingella denitrificans]|uniref:hypothetical protein n=1 Tax=Kingella denitrificans TaxID=502 RepID=UPI0028D39DC8|nr:hypothetical protein [Kingella denitrificans]